MKNITPEILKAVMPNATMANCQTYAPLINQYAQQFGITTDVQMAHYLAQIAHESGELRYTEELASGSAYEGRKDLGNVIAGDGKKFKGRGLIQITGRANYKAYSDYLVKNGMSVDLTKTPELLAKPLGAVKSSMWFCQRKGICQKAFLDKGAMVVKTVKDNGKTKVVKVNAALLEITRIVNGGYNGIEQRQKYYTRAVNVLHVLFT